MSVQAAPLRRGEPISRIRLGRFVLAALAVLLVMFGGLELLARYCANLAQPPDSGFIQFDHKFNLARQPVRHHPVILFLGDSIMEGAIYPELLSRRLETHGIHADIRNLAVGGNSPLMTLALLRDAYRHGLHPQTVFYGFTYRTVNAPALSHHDLERGQAFNRSYLNRCVLNTPAGMLSPMRCALEGGSFLVRYRHFLKFQLDRLSQIWTHPQDPNAYLSDTPLSPDGWAPRLPTLLSPEGVRTEMAHRYGHFTPKPLIAVGRPIPWWTEAQIRRLLIYCNRHHIHAVLTLLPEPEFMETVYPRELRLTRAQFVSAGQALAARYHAGFLDMGDNVDVSEFADWEPHLNSIGAIHATEQLAFHLVSHQQP